MKIPQSIKQLKRQKLEELCLRLMNVNHEAVHRANEYEDKYDMSLTLFDKMPISMPCEFDEEWFNKNQKWCDEHCEDTCKHCWNKYIEDRMCEKGETNAKGDIE